MEKSKRNSGTSDGKCLIIHSQGVVNCSMLRNKSSYLCVLMFSHLFQRDVLFCAGILLVCFRDQCLQVLIGCGYYSTVF